MIEQFTVLHVWQSHQEWSHVEGTMEWDTEHPNPKRFWVREDGTRLKLTPGGHLVEENGENGNVRYVFYDPGL